ncbi:MAG TPA: NADH-ubiquinone oxidoreductase-F iron-sulfur binding region domain-containing protein [Acidimicrobiales bacterium]|jgi:NADH:ubiquinone oxidoreductase subunit F (NADH-binding)|nr:NADH-ubiquinone oxidoreductase-F iron-sulfur binding region domain-containing protein [Acidimicrobiales bacterium]
MVSASETLPETKRYRILGTPSDLAGHVAALGPAPLPTRSSRTWRESFVSRLEASGLPGRGGAGFPAAIKLAVAHGAGGRGTVVVNGMEGEPASDKDKLLLLRTPHLVLDGAQLLAAACGARRVTVCVPEGRDHVAAAVANAMSERAGTTHAPANETLVRPPDRFVAGEESALVRWIDSGASLPAFRPDKGMPLRIGRQGALVHNAETLAHVAMIARTGPEAFRAHGLVEDPGTCLVTISGAVENHGVVEVDRGTPLMAIAQRATPHLAPKALLVGGYGGAWVGPEDFETPYASLSLRAVGSSAGVGVVIVLGPDSCGLMESARIVHYLAGQSAGQCGPCVYGLPAIADDMARLARGRVDVALMARLDRRLHEVNGRGACRHPDGAVQLVRSALKVFAADVREHAAGAPCAHADRPTVLRFPSLLGTGGS